MEWCSTVNKASGRARGEGNNNRLPPPPHPLEFCNTFFCPSFSLIFSPFFLLEEPQWRSERRNIKSGGPQINSCGILALVDAAPAPNSYRDFYSRARSKSFPSDQIFEELNELTRLAFVSAGLLESSSLALIFTARGFASNSTYIAGTNAKLCRTQVPCSQDSCVRLQLHLCFRLVVAQV